MAIDIETEQTMTMNEARKAFPGRGTVSLATIHRWRSKGIRGVQLEAYRIGQEWRTSAEARIRFVEALNPVAIGKETPGQLSRRQMCVKQELADMGIK